MTAKVDPTAFGNTPILGHHKPFELRLHNIPVEHFIPNGDRYIVETIAVDETVQFGRLLAVVQDQQINPNDPQADPRVEVRGIVPAVVITKGNGHLLGLPDPRIRVHNAGALGDDVERHAADVPMFYEPGDVVLVDHNAKGRNLRVAGREVRVINQIDVLCHVTGIKLHREDGVWVQEETEG